MVESVPEGRLAGVEAGRRADFRFPRDCATATGSTTNVGGGVNTGSMTDKEAYGVTEKILLCKTGEDTDDDLDDLRDRFVVTGRNDVAGV